MGLSWAPVAGSGAGRMPRRPNADIIGPWELLIIVLAIGLLVGANGLPQMAAASATTSANSTAPSMRAANPAPLMQPRGPAPTARLSGSPVRALNESMSWFRPRDLLDQTFEVGIILKGLDGVLEVLGGLLLLVVSPATIDRVVTSLTQHELSEDPHDFLAAHLLRTAHGLTGSAVLFGAVYLLAHGLVKVVLVVALLKNQLWAYPWTIAFLGVFIVYQLYRLSLRASVGLTVLTIFDALIAWLTYREYRKQLAVARR